MKLTQLQKKDNQLLSRFYSLVTSLNTFSYNKRLSRNKFIYYTAHVDPSLSLYLLHYCGRRRVGRLTIVAHARSLDRALMCCIT